MLTLPPPGATAANSAALGAAAPAGSWRVVHVLYEGCGCSRRVVEHLLTDPRPAGVAERILYVGGDAERIAALRARGFSVEPLTRAGLVERYQIESAPLLLIADPAGQVRYSGGYSGRKQGPALLDLEILSGLMAGHAVPELPLFGCAVGRALAAQLNPLSAASTGD